MTRWMSWQIDEPDWQIWSAGHSSNPFDYHHHRQPSMNCMPKGLFNMQIAIMEVVGRFQDSAYDTRVKTLPYNAG